MLLLQPGVHGFDKLRKHRVITGGERDKPYLVISGAFHKISGDLEDLLGGTFTHRASEHPRLAETAPSGASPKNLHRSPIVNNFRERDYYLPWIVRRIQIRHVAAHHGRGGSGEAEKGDIDSRYAGAFAQPLLPRHSSAVSQNLQQLRQSLFALSHAKGIEKESHRLRHIGSGTSPDHHRISLSPIFAPEGNLTEIEHGEDVRVGKLILQSKSQYVKILQGAGVLQRFQRIPLLPQSLLHIPPGTVSTLHGKPGVLPKEAVENLKSQIAHPHLVDIGKGETYPKLTWLFRSACSKLSPHIAGWRFHIREKRQIGIRRFSVFFTSHADPTPRLCHAYL
jgi:hypothetical protein